MKAHVQESDGTGPAVNEARALSPAASLFHSLSDPARLAILRHLAAGEHRVVDLTAHLGLAQSGPCACGNPLPAIQVQGRAAYALTFPDAHGSSVTITPLTLSALLDRVPGVELAQIVQTAPTRLSVRLRPAAGAEREQVWRSLATEIDSLLRAHGLDVALHLDGAPPQATAGGKYRLVQPLRSTDITES